MRCGCGDRDGIEARSDLGNGTAALGVTAECVAHDVKEGLGKSVGKDRIRLIVQRQNRQLLREGLNEGHAQGPDICANGERGVRNFRGVIGVGPARWSTGLACGEKSVAGELEPIGSGENV